MSAIRLGIAVLLAAVRMNSRQFVVPFLKDIPELAFLVTFLNLLVFLLVNESSLVRYLVSTKIAALSLALLRINVQVQ